MYSVWIKIDNGLPWIELEETFRTKAEARAAMKEKRSKFSTRIVKVSSNREAL